MPRRLAPSLVVLTMCLSVLALPSAAAGSDVTLSVTKLGTGGGTVTSAPAGIDCGATCSFAFAPSTVASLTAVAGSSSTFMGWSGAVCSGAAACSVTMDTALAVTAHFARSYRPDAWIKLCGLSTGCVIGPPPPHPWRGNDVYNTTGFKQKVAVRMEDGEGVRFWIVVQNDGARGDSLLVQGCKGTPRFVINAVLLGKQTRPNWQAVNITKKFKNGTARFSFPPTSTKKNVVFTLNIVAPTTAEGVTYRCPITISSAARPALKDTVVAIMTTY